MPYRVDGTVKVDVQIEVDRYDDLQELMRLLSDEVALEGTNQLKGVEIEHVERVGG